MLLNADHLSFSYSRHSVLAGVTLRLNPGEVVALLGPNGSGKSTLIRCLLGHLQASGNIHWRDKPLRQWHRRDLAREVAYLAQAPAWDAGQRVSDVLRMGRAPYLKAFGIESQLDVEVVREVADALKLSDLIDRSLDTLSGGQRQRVFLGRCLVQEPSALLLDEPNTFLDLRHQVELGHLLVGLARQKKLGILMASHDLNLAGQFAGRLVLLSQGRVVADGPPSEVLHPDLLERVYELPMERLDRPDGSACVFPRIGQS